MTLLELVVALAIIGLAVSAGFGALAMLGDRQHAADAAEGRDARAAAVRHELVTWLADARLVPDDGGPEFRGLDGVRDDADAPNDAVSLLFVDRDSATPEHGLTASFAPWRGTAVRRVELDPHVAGLNIRYLSASLGRLSWFPSWVTSTLLPSGLEVRLIPAPGDSLPALLRLPILVPLRSGS